MGTGRSAVAMAPRRSQTRWFTDLRARGLSKRYLRTFLCFYDFQTHSGNEIFVYRAQNRRTMRKRCGCDDSRAAACIAASRQQILSGGAPLFLARESARLLYDSYRQTSGMIPSCGYFVQVAGRGRRIPPSTSSA